MGKKSQVSASFSNEYPDYAKNWSPEFREQWFTPVPTRSAREVESASRTTHSQFPAASPAALPADPLQRAIQLTRQATEAYEALVSAIEDRDDAIRELRQRGGRSLAMMADDLDIPRSTLHRIVTRFSG